MTRQISYVRVRLGQVGCDKVRQAKIRQLCCVKSCLGLVRYDKADTVGYGSLVSIRCG